MKGSEKQIAYARDIMRRIEPLLDRAEAVLPGGESTEAARYRTERRRVIERIRTEWDARKIIMRLKGVHNSIDLDRVLTHYQCHPESW